LARLSRFTAYKPNFKLWLATNHYPEIRGSDPAIWNRICLIPFSVTIPDNEIDHCLPATLKKELSGILNWSLFGNKKWRSSGLQPPEAVKRAVVTYRNDMDVVGQFLDEVTIFCTHTSITKAKLHTEYCEYCEKNGEKPLKIRLFGKKIKGHGIKESVVRLVKCWIGIDFKPYI